MGSKLKAYAALLAGGSGTRLWPVSRERMPKQMVSFTGGDSLIQTTVKRLSPALDTENLRIVCGEEHFHEIARHLSEIGIDPDGKIIREPCGRNTAPAILLAVMNILETEKDAVIFVFPADHVIADVDKFHEKIRQAADLAENGRVVMFGIEPGYPETGYGYVEGGASISDVALEVERFVEKPDRKTAIEYIEAGRFFWNSGMFAFRASVIAGEFGKFHPDILDAVKSMTSKNEITKSEYEKVKNISIDYAVMEKTGAGAILPSDFGWSDIGSWKSLHDFLPKDENGNVVSGDAIVHETQNCLIMGRDRLVAVNRVKDLAVIETEDSVFVSDLETSRDVKIIVGKLKDSGRREYRTHETVRYPWGTRTLMERNEGFETAKLAVTPGSTLHLENGGTTVNLFVISGQMKTTVEGVKKCLSGGESLRIGTAGGTSIENAGTETLHVISALMKKGN